MRYIYLTMLISCTALGCSVSRQICKKENPPPQIRKVCIGADGCIPDDCVQLKTLPYREQRLKCFGGKANYNTELALSEKLIICPYGPVSRGMDHDLESYSARVRVPLDSNRQRVMWQVETVYEKTNDTAVVLLLTVENMQDWKHRFVRVEEIPSGMYAHIVNRKLEEKESIVVFNSIGIFIKSSGDEKFRGYLFEQIQTIDNGIK